MNNSGDDSLPKSYNEYSYWQKYQPFFPEALRSPQPNQMPAEQFWKWRDNQVHVDRVDISTSPFRIILIHGAGGYGRFLSPLGFIFSKEGYSWMAPDLPGYGLTHPRRRDFEYNDWVQMLSDLIDHETALDSRPTVLFGLSLGGMLAYQVAARNKNVAGIIATTLIDCSKPEVVKRISKYEFLSEISNFLIRKFSFLLDSVKIPIALVSKMDQMSNNPTFNALVARDRVGGANLVSIKFLRTLSEMTFDVQPEDFDRPVLLAHPAVDTWTPVALSEAFFHRLGSRKQLVLLENCGHAPIEQPGTDQLREVALTFIASLGASISRPNKDA